MQKLLIFFSSENAQLSVFTAVATRCWAFFYLDEASFGSPTSLILRWQESLWRGWVLVEGILPGLAIWGVLRRFTPFSLPVDVRTSGCLKKSLVAPVIKSCFLDWTLGFTFGKEINRVVDFVPVFLFLRIAPLNLHTRVSDGVFSSVDRHHSRTPAKPFFFR